MISGSNLDEQTEAAQTISSNFHLFIFFFKKNLFYLFLLLLLDIAAGPYDLWIKSVSTVPYLISLLDSDNMVNKKTNETKKKKLAKKKK